MRRDSTGLYIKTETTADISSGTRNQNERVVISRITNIPGMTKIRADKMIDNQYFPAFITFLLF
jgi:hypothetical protein